MLQYQSLQYYLCFSTWLISLLNGEKWYVTNWERKTGKNKAETVSTEHVKACCVAGFFFFWCFFADHSSLQGSSPPGPSGRHPCQIYHWPALPERADGREPEDSRLVNPVLCRLPAAKWAARALKGKLIHTPFTVWMADFLCEAVRSQRVLYCELVERLELTGCRIKTPCGSFVS